MNQFASVTTMAANKIQPSTPLRRPGSRGTRKEPAMPHSPPQKASDRMVGTPQGGTGRRL